MTPHSNYLIVYVFVWEHDQVLIPDDGPSQFQVAVELGGFVGTVHSLHRGEEARTVLDQTEHTQKHPVSPPTPPQRVNFMCETGCAVRGKGTW
jgi:hypothetical protein